MINPTIQVSNDEKRKILCIGYFNPVTTQLEFETVEDVPLEELQALIAKFCQDYQVRGLKIQKGAL